MQLVCAYHAGKTQYSTALRICNQSKNRSPDLLPTDSHRVFLSPSSEDDGADYINASWLTGEAITNCGYAGYCPMFRAVSVSDT